MSEKENKAIAKAGALALPDFVNKEDNRGAENVTGTDIRLPRLCMAQKASPEIEDGNAKRIEGLKFGDMFSNMFQTIFGRGPLEVVIVRREAPRAIEFYPMDSKVGKGIKDRDVPYFGVRNPKNDPRTQFGPNGEKPVATALHEYVAFAYETREPFLLSFKTESINQAVQLDTIRAFRGGPYFATTFLVRTVQKQNDKGTYFVFSVQPGRKIDEATFKYAGDVLESIKGKTVAVDDVETEREPGADDEEL